MIARERPQQEEVLRVHGYHSHSVTVNVLLAALTLSAAPVVCGQDYGKTMEREVEKSLGQSQFKHYEWLSYPTNNFGIMTTFIVNKPGGKVRSGDQECATFTCIGQNQDALTAPQVMDVNGYADVGLGGAITLSDDEKNSLTLSSVLPSILSVLNLSGALNSSHGITTKLTIGPATLRFLVKQKAEDYIKSLPDTSRIKVAYRQNRLGLVIADVVLETMDVDLKVDKKMNASLDASLTGKVDQVFGKGDKLSVAVQRAGDGEYTLKISHPVVIARLIATKALSTDARGGDLQGKLIPWNRGWVVTSVEESPSPAH